MSALLAGASATFSYQGASVTLSCSSPIELKNALATFGIGQAANDSGNVPPVTAAVTKGPQQTAAPSAPAVAAPAAQADAGNASASTAAPASAPPAAAGSATSAGEAGNVGTTAGTAAAPTASSSEPAASPAVSFDELKKAFLALSTKPAGREKCEAVLKAVDPAPAKLSAATPEQYPALMAAIQKASA